MYLSDAIKVEFVENEEQQLIKNKSMGCDENKQAYNHKFDPGQLFIIKVVYAFFGLTSCINNECPKSK